MKFMAMVGSSMWMRGSGPGASGAAIVSPTRTPSSPAIAMMSPASARAISTRWSPSARSRRVTLPRESPPAVTIGFFIAIVPSAMRPVAISPTWGSQSSIVACIRNGRTASAAGAGTCARTASSSGAMSLPGRLRSAVAVPFLADAKISGKSSCASVALSSQKRSNTVPDTASGVARSRSILLTTTSGRRPSSSDLRSTYFVCGIGPSTASTSSSTPSTIRRTRSTSLPKSAWPGVSTTLMRTPR